MKIPKFGRIDSTMISYFLPHLWKKCICSNFKIEQDTEANKGFKKDILGQFYQRSLGSFYASSLTQILLVHGVEHEILAYFVAMRISKAGRIFVGETEQRRCRQRMTTRTFAPYAIRLVKLTPCVFQNRSRDNLFSPTWGFWLTLHLSTIFEEEENNFRDEIHQSL